jgi:putative membrane protein
MTELPPTAAREADARVTNPRADRAFYAFALAFSALALSVIAWLLLFRDGSGSTADVRSLPALNASLNATAAVLLTAGWLAIRRKNRVLHQRLMVSAFCVSAIFLASYLTYHYIHGDTKYPIDGAWRLFYLGMLASHVLLSLPVLPLALLAFWFAYRRDFVRHRKITRFLAPIWVYVSVTGVLVFLMLRSAVG